MQQPWFGDLWGRTEWRESRGNPFATSPVGAFGPAQIMPATAAKPGFGLKGLTPEQYRDPEQNRAFGQRYLDMLLNRYDGDVERALVGYNYGPGKADEWDGRRSSLPKETRDYLSEIVDGRGVEDKFGGPFSTNVSNAPERLQAVQGEHVTLSPSVEPNQIRAALGSPLASQAPLSQMVAQAPGDPVPVASDPYSHIAPVTPSVTPQSPLGMATLEQPGIYDMANKQSPLGMVPEGAFAPTAVASAPPPPAIATAPAMGAEPDFASQVETQVASAMGDDPFSGMIGELEGLFGGIEDAAGGGQKMAVPQAEIKQLSGYAAMPQQVSPAQGRSFGRG